MFGHVVLHLAGTVNTNIANTTAAKNIQALMSSAGTWIAGLGTTGGGLMIAYHAIMRNLSGGDASTDAHHLAMIKKVVVGTVVVAGAGGLAHFAGGIF